MCANICDGEVVCVYVGFEEVGDLVGGFVVSCDSKPSEECVFA